MRGNQIGRRGASTCAYCGGSNDGISSICTRPACLARYWRRMAESARQAARDYDAKAERLEAEAAMLQLIADLEPVVAAAIEADKAGKV